MQSRFILIFSILTILFFASCSTTQNIALPNTAKDYKSFENEDTYILFALEHTNQGEYKNAIELYYELFEKTGKTEYLLKALGLAVEIKDYLYAKEKSFANLNPTLKEYEEIYRVYIVSLVNLEEYDLALQNAQTLLNNYNNTPNKELMANIYFIKKDFANASLLFEEIYKDTLSPTSLINLADILYGFTNEQKKAVNYLQSHIRINGCDDFVCSKLLSIYEEQRDIDGVIFVLKKMYDKFKLQEDFNSTIKTYSILITYLEQKSIDDAIKFLEQNHIDDTKLIELYKRANRLDKALQLTKKLYKLNGNIDLLAQIAILEFESAKDKKKVLKSVVAKFEDVLHILNSDLYQNYLGYLLIDNNLDVKKGVKLVQKALKKSPNNYAYIDSLAWGLYKQKRCQEAYVQMKRVVDAIGLDEEEIKLHWNSIKKCADK